MVMFRSRRATERLLVVAIIGVILALSALFYARLADDVRRLRFEIMAERFRLGVTAVRIATYVHQDSKELERGIELHALRPGEAHSAAIEPPTRVFINDHGWPAASEAHLVQKPSVEACRQLWYALLHQPPEATADKPLPDEYQVTLTKQGLCRYQTQERRGRNVYFEYSPESGEVIVRSQEE